MRDLTGDYSEVFARGPAALEFLGERVPPPVPYQRSEGTDSAEVEIAENTYVTPPTFYSRAAIVFWPRAHW